MFHVGASVYVRVCVCVCVCFVVPAPCVVSECCFVACMSYVLVGMVRVECGIWVCSFSFLGSSFINLGLCSILGSSVGLGSWSEVHTCVLAQVQIRAPTPLRPPHPCLCPCWGVPRHPVLAGVTRPTPMPSTVHRGH